MKNPALNEVLGIQIISIQFKSRTSSLATRKNWARILCTLSKPNYSPLSNAMKRFWDKVKVLWDYVVYIARCVVKNGHQKNMCHNNSGLCASIKGTILWLPVLEHLRRTRIFISAFYSFLHLNSD
jgi:hypothetical protein